MIQTSFDPAAGTLYWYMTDIEVGSTALEGECDGALLLDDDGQVIGLELELDASVSREDLALALQHAGVRYDAAPERLVIALCDDDPSIQPLDQPVILDFDAAGRLQGCEIGAAAVFELERRLLRLAPWMVDIDDAVDLSAEVAARLAADAAAPDDADDGDAAVALAVSAPDTRAVMPADGTTIRRAGFIALVGRPNVGKSTLLNAILGQHVAIVSAKPQTTRSLLRGMLVRNDAQLVFVDTPGIHPPRTRLGTMMVEQARRTIPDADVVCMVVDISVPPRRLDADVAALVRRTRAPRILVLNKVDLPNPQGGVHLDAYRELGPWDMEIAVSARDGVGLTLLLDELTSRLPSGPPLYPSDQLTDQSDREHVAELIREQVLRLTEQEVPHSVAIEIEEWLERERGWYIRATIYVEKDSQRGIVIGSAGNMLRRIGSAARVSIERHLACVIYLDLWVKVRTGWRDDPTALHWLGYRRSTGESS